MRRRQTLSEWIHEALTDKDKDAECTAISLCHMVGTSPVEVHTRKVTPGINVPDLATMLLKKAESYAQDMPGMQSFALLAFYGTNEPGARHPFQVNGETGYFGNATEAPTPQGEKMQSMRHQEMMVQMAFRHTAAMIEQSTRMIERLGDRVDSLMRENHDAYDIVRDMLGRQVTEQHERRMEALRFERSTAERKKWLTFAPALINTVLGREIFPQSTADTALVETITDSLTEDQIQKLSSVLPPELWGPMAQRMMLHLEKKQAEQEAVKKLAGSSSVDAELGE